MKYRLLLVANTYNASQRKQVVMWEGNCESEGMERFEALSKMAKVLVGTFELLKGDTFCVELEKLKGYEVIVSC